MTDEKRIRVVSAAWLVSIVYLLNTFLFLALLPPVGMALVWILMGVAGTFITIGIAWYLYGLVYAVITGRWP